MTSAVLGLAIGRLGTPPLGCLGRSSPFPMLGFPDGTRGSLVGRGGWPLAVATGYHYDGCQRHHPGALPSSQHHFSPEHLNDHGVGPAFRRGVPTARSSSTAERLYCETASR